MSGSKSAHLVERAAERLLQSGVLEGSAAQLLETDRPRTAPAPQSEGQPAPVAQPVAAEMPAPAMPAREVQAPRAPERAPARPVIDVAALERAGMFDWSRGRSRISEEFRLAQRQLLRIAFAPDAEPGLSNLLMVTSARPGEGKSFTALNLAGSVALQG